MIKRARSRTPPPGQGGRIGVPLPTLEDDCAIFLRDFLEQQLHEAVEHGDRRDVVLPDHQDGVVENAGEDPSQWVPCGAGEAEAAARSGTRKGRRVVLE